MQIGKRLLATVLWAVVVLAAAVNTQKAANDRNQKLVQLRKLALASSNYIVEMDSKMYDTFVEQSPRPYTVIILFYSANNEASEDVYKEYIFAAGHWKDKETHFTQLHGGKEFKRPIFFAAVKFSQDTMRIYRDLDLRGVPDVLVSTPQEVSFKDPLER